MPTCGDCKFFIPDPHMVDPQEEEEPGDPGGALQESQQRVKKLETENTRLKSVWTRSVVDIVKENNEQQTVIQELAEALRESLQLGQLAVMSEERSSSHYHGPKAANRYAKKALALENKIRAALANASPWLPSRGADKNES